MEDKTKNINSRVLFTGNLEEQTRFNEEHWLFLDKVSNLTNARNAGFARDVEPPSSLVDKLVFSLGLNCSDDFDEIFLLCGNGYGVGGQKILRGMYERAVTAWYLHRHPEEAENFFDFGAVYSYRSKKKLEDIYGKKFFDSNPVSRENFARVEKEYNKVKDKFTVPQHKKGKKPRLYHTWNKLGFASMAKEVPELRDPFLIFIAYDEPTQQIHATLEAIRTKTMESSTGEGVFGRNIEQERATLKRTLHVSHLILLSVLQLQYQHFDLKSLEQPLQRCRLDYEEIWSSPASGTTDL